VDYTGKRIAAVFLSAEQGTRRGAEDALAREITKRGAQGVPAYSIVSIDELRDERYARAKLQQSGCKGAVMMRITGKTQEISATPAAWAGGRYSSFSGYSVWGWGTVYSSGYLTTDTIVSLETLVYDLDEDKLHWAGVSETFDPAKIDAFVTEIADAVAKEMKKEGLIR
jgi:hypothetical protein